jgi:hypothetical protein
MFSNSDIGQSVGLSERRSYVVALLISKGRQERGNGRGTAFRDAKTSLEKRMLVVLIMVAVTV